MRFLRQNTATRVTVGPFLDQADGISPEISLTVTNDLLTFTVDDGGVPTLVIDAAPTASGGANDMVHITSDAAGFYDLELTAAQLNYVGRAMLAITDAAHHCPVFHEFMIVPANVYDSLFGTDKLDVNAAEVGGTAQTGRDIGASVLLDAAYNAAKTASQAGDAMTLTAAYDAAKTAAQAGNEMDLVNAPNATAVTAIQAGLATAAALTTVDGNVDAIKAKTDLIPAAGPADAAQYTAARAAKLDGIGGAVASVTAPVTLATASVEAVTNRQLGTLMYTRKP